MLLNIGCLLLIINKLSNGKRGVSFKVKVCFLMVWFLF